jgi:hypothetical protein
MRWRAGIAVQPEIGQTTNPRRLVPLRELIAADPDLSHDDAPFGRTIPLMKPGVRASAASMPEATSWRP